MPNSQKLSQLIHDLAGSLTVLTLCLPQLEESSPKEVRELCHTALEEAKQVVQKMRHLENPAFHQKDP